MIRFLYGLGGMILGILILKYSFKILKFFGKDPDLERVLGAGLGGTYFFIKLFGLFLIILSMLYLFGFILPSR